jgi:hypothetical protein
MAVANTLAYYDTATITTVKRFITPAHGVNPKKLFTVVIYSFRNKLECLSLNTRLDWKGLQGRNTLVYYENRKLRP